MTPRNFIIVSKSYIIRKGIIHLIKSFPHKINVFEASDFKLMKKITCDADISKIFIDSEIADNIENTILTNLNIDIILIVQNKNDIEKHKSFRNCLIISQDKSKLIENIESFLSFSPKEEKYNTSLSEREKDVLRCVALGLINKEIADRLFISLHTVITHRKNITGKLGIKTVAGLTVFAILNKLVKMEEVK